MDTRQVNEWGKALDAAEMSPITANLPKLFASGDRFHETGSDGSTTCSTSSDDVHREWLAIEIIAGNSGGRWGYWAPWIDPATGRYGVGPNPKRQAIADAIFNGDAAHFIGMLGLPYTRIPGTSSTVWVLVSPRLVAPPTIRIVDEKPATRYEKSKDVFDVDTQETRKLP